VDPLIAVLKDGNKDKRKGAIKALGEIGDARAVEPLITALKDKVAYVRKVAAEALGKVGDARAVEPLVVALKDYNQGAVEALDRLGWQPDMGEHGAWYWVIKQDWTKCLEIGAHAMEPLIAALGDRDNSVRRSAAEVLSKIGDSHAVEPLIQLFKDVGYEVKSLKDCENWNASALALRMLYQTGKLGIEAKQAILSQREKIIQGSHGDYTTKIPHIDFFVGCIHTDANKEHTDRHYRGIEFPL